MVEVGLGVNGVLERLTVLLLEVEAVYLVVDALIVVVLQALKEVRDDLDVVGLLHNLHQLLRVQLGSHHLQQAVEQGGLLLELEQDALEEQLLVGDLGDDVQELFVREGLRRVLDDGVDGVVKLVGALVKEDHLFPALIEFALLDEFVGVQVVDLGAAVVHQFGRVVLALEDTQFCEQNVVYLLRTQSAFEEDEQVLDEVLLLILRAHLFHPLLVLDHMEPCDAGFGEILEAHALPEEFEPDLNAVGFLGLLHGAVELTQVHQTHGQLVVVARLGPDLLCLLEEAVLSALLAHDLPVHVDVVVDEVVKVHGLVEFGQREHERVVHPPVLDAVLLAHHAQLLDQVALVLLLFGLGDHLDLVCVVLGLDLVVDTLLHTSFLQLLLGQPGEALVVAHLLAELDSAVVVIQVGQQDVDRLLVLLGPCLLLEHVRLFLQVLLCHGLAGQQLCVLVVETRDVLLALLGVGVEAVGYEQLLELTVAAVLLVVEDQFL